MDYEFFDQLFGKRTITEALTEYEALFGEHPMTVETENAADLTPQTLLRM